MNSPGEVHIRSAYRLSILAIALLSSTTAIALAHQSSDLTVSQPSDILYDDDPNALHVHVQLPTEQIPFSMEDTSTSDLKEDQHFNHMPYVSLPVDNPTHSFWLDTPNANPLRRVGSTGPLTRDADVCIVGSGITGVSAAWHLSSMLQPAGMNPSSANSSNPNFRVVVLEAREFCSGATGRNGGHLLANPFRSFISRQIKHGTAEAIKSYQLEQYGTSSLVKFLQSNGLADDVDLFQGDHVTIFTSAEEEAEARKDFDAAKDAGLSLDPKVHWIETEELSRSYGIDPKLGYTGVFYSGYNLWPCKAVTELYKGAVTMSDNVDVRLHTRTPVTSITPLRTGPSSDALPGSDSRTRRWALQTPRGTVRCAYVVHGTNAYSAHLLPFLAGEDHDDLSNDLQKRSPGSYGIIPTRGQVGTVRASVDSAHLGWHNSWGGSGGWEYWFPRFQDINSPLNTTDDSASPINADAARTRNPLIVLGGGRQHSGGNLEMGTTDDSELNLQVTIALRNYLPHLFPGKFRVLADGAPAAKNIEDPWEMEWSGIMGFTKTGDPFVGPVSYPDSLVAASPFDGQYIAAGYSGHGMPRAYACAEAVAGMIHARLVGAPWERPSWLPSWYLNWASNESNT